MAQVLQRPTDLLLLGRLDIHSPQFTFLFGEEQVLVVRHPGHKNDRTRFFAIGQSHDFIRRATADWQNDQ